MRDLQVSGDLVIAGAQVLLPTGIEDTTVRVRDGRIHAIGGGVSGEVVHGDGLLLAPAVIDVHGDAFERQVMPRPGVHVPLEIAILDTDRQMASNGIATAYHALTLSWEPGLRGVEQGRDFLDALAALAPRLTVEHRVQLRWETFAFEAVDLIEDAMQGPVPVSLAFNDHTSMQRRDFDLKVTERPFEHDPDFPLCDPSDPRMAARVAGSAQRAGLSVVDYLALMDEVWQRRAEVPAMIARLAGAGRRAGIPMLSHDDTVVATRDWYRGHGVTVAEFPMQRATAEAARAAGDPLIFGAPNGLRGGSHIGSLGTAQMTRDGLCDAIASDYFYPAMLGALGRMAREGVAGRERLWSLVSDGPARAMGLTDRCRIAEGQRADLVLVDWPEDGFPAVRRTWVAGRTAYQGTPRG